MVYSILEYISSMYLLSVYVCHGTLSLLITTHPVMRTSPMRTAPAVHSAIKMMGKLVTANCHW